MQWTLGQEARQALLAATCTLLFLGMASALISGIRSFAKDTPVEAVVLALLIAGIGVLNTVKFAFILQGGLEALNMNSRFQTVFYLYMSFLGSVIPPAVVWRMNSEPWPRMIR